LSVRSFEPTWDSVWVISDSAIPKMARMTSTSSTTM
jgi:hypothetical protein